MKKKYYRIIGFHPDDAYLDDSCANEGSVYVGDIVMVEHEYFRLEKDGYFSGSFQNMNKKPGYFFGAKLSLCYIV